MLPVSAWKTSSTKFVVYGVLVLLLVACAKVRAIYDVPEISFGEASSFATIEALTDAPIITGNKLGILQNGDGTFPLMLREIQNAKSTITFAQYLVKGGVLASEFARSFAERCQAGIKVYILLDSQGSKGPKRLPQPCPSPAVNWSTSAALRHRKWSSHGSS
jgi:phosphatidylserine/phosphatidylglycerophosphate/cardiolipin synthase-like enzyme